jgi:antitoxin MazE
MKVKVAKWGNSLGVRLPKAAAEAAGLKAGSELEVTVEGSDLRLKKKPLRIPHYRLKDMVAEMKRLGGRDAEPETVEWGPDRGEEIIDDEYSRGEITLDDLLGKSKKNAS